MIISRRATSPRPISVTRNVKPTAPRPKRYRPLTAAEARQFLDATRTDRLHALYELALRTGLRKGELLGLHWENIDLNAGTASVRRSLQRTRTGGLTHLPTKTRGHAHIGVAGVYAHVRLRLQRDAIDLLGNALRDPAKAATRPDDGDEPPLCAAPVR